MTLIENLREWFCSDTSRNKNASIFSGILFFSGWWILIDALARYHQYINTGEVFIGVFGTISFIMVNVITDSQLSDVSLYSGQTAFYKVWLLVGLVIGFSSVIASFWVMVELFIQKEDVPSAPGIALVVENLLILISSLVYKFGRSEENWAAF